MNTAVDGEQPQPSAAASATQPGEQDQTATPISSFRAEIDHLDAEITSIITDHTFPDLTESDTALCIPLTRKLSFTEAAYEATEEMVNEVKDILERFLGSPMPSYFSYEDHLCEIIGVYCET